MFIAAEVPVASSMIAFIGRRQNVSDTPITVFTCLWMAFNNIYITIGDRNGLKPKIKYDKKGNIKIRKYGSVSVPVVVAMPESKLLNISFEKFNDDLKHNLIMHESTRYFVDRTPRWQDVEIKHDKNGQRLNGVINVGYTTSVNDPVWSPIDTAMYISYTTGDQNIQNRNNLAKQILDLVYTIRCNIVHGGKRMDDAYADEVIYKTIPLLRIIVEYFLQ